MGVNPKLTRLLSIPAPLLAAKLAQVVAARMRAPALRAADRSRSTYGPKTGEHLGRVLRGREWAFADTPDWLSQANDATLRHEFDLLGSGPKRVALQAKQDEALLKLLARHLPEGSREEAASLAARLPASYKPLDWQLDFRSGHRWPVPKWYRDVPIALGHGADIKVPWELGRLQHLPLLGLEYASADDKRAAQLWDEFKAQVVDFQAQNPPRWGVQWRCTMDVAIRIANVLLARDMFLAASAPWEEAFEVELARMARDHAAHIVSNLEWSPAHTGNHYLANVCGLVFASAYLPRSAETDAWLAFAVQELVAETEKQFLGDGGNYEGSTSYHRLSAEMVLLATALTLALPEEKVHAIEHSETAEWKRKPPLRPAPRPMFGVRGSVFRSPFPPAHFEALVRMRHFTESLSKPDGTVVQIGDNDSGRFFNLGDPKTPSLDHRGLIQALDALAKTGKNMPSDPAARIVRLLSVNLPASSLPPAAPIHGDWSEPAAARLAELFSLAEPLPIGRKQHYRVTLGPGVWEGLTVAEFPDFGVYCLRSDRAYLAFRCGRLSHDGRGGHGHSDALSIELWADGKSILRDPGTYTYTADPAARNRYRSAAAHASPHVSSHEPNPLDVSMFLLPDRCRSQALVCGDAGVAGCHFGYQDLLTRVVRLTPDGLEILDFLTGDGDGRLAREDYEALKGPSHVCFSPGYGQMEVANT
ncbi:MAG: alginate lyase family protein [Armatimonadetes bacterium]|nr:alginate lyase family protein [Armatimonadota bacterium]